jgi:hypothetical protein
MKNGGRHRKPHIIARQSATDGGDIQEPWMNKGRTGIRRFRRLFGYFLAAQKVTQPVETVDKQNRYSFIHSKKTPAIKLYLP